MLKPNIESWRFLLFFPHFWQLKTSKIISFFLVFLVLKFFFCQNFANIKRAEGGWGGFEGVDL
jgi:hypothetical protein